MNKNKAMFAATLGLTAAGLGLAMYSKMKPGPGANPAPASKYWWDGVRDVGNINGGKHYCPERDAQGNNVPMKNPDGTDKTDANGNIVYKKYEDAFYIPHVNYCLEKQQAFVGAAIIGAVMLTPVGGAIMGMVKKKESKGVVVKAEE